MFVCLVVFIVRELTTESEVLRYVIDKHILYYLINIDKYM